MYAFLLLIDLLLLAVAVLTMARVARASVYHPATLILAFHVYTVTLRVATLAMGVPSSYLLGVTDAEFVKAIVLYDAALVTMVVTWWLAHLRERRRERAPAAPPAGTTLKWPVVIALAVLLAPMMRLAVQRLSAEGALLGEWASSSYLYAATAWPAELLFLAIFREGFKKWLVVPGVVVLLYTALYTHRFMFVTLVIMTGVVYLWRRGRRWPSRLLALAGVGFVCLWLVFKPIRAAVTGGEGAAAGFREARERLQGMTQGDIGATDLVILDMGAATIGLVDGYGHYFPWVSILPALVAPIPRQLWPNKPSLASNVLVLSTVDRPLDKYGMVPTLVGDAYMNFGPTGVIVVAGLFSWALCIAYYRMLRRPLTGTGRLLYLVYFANIPQLLRDGLLSLLIFPLMNYIPIFLAVGASAVVALLARVRLTRRRELLPAE